MAGFRRVVCLLSLPTCAACSGSNSEGEGNNAPASGGVTAAEETGTGLAGASWRLPTVNEIASIVDDVPSGDVSPATDPDVFPDTAPDAQYWSQSPYGTGSDEHWTLNFGDGFTAHRGNDVPGIARCVR